MIAWVRDFFQFLIGKPTHPIYRREQVGWSYIGAWRKLRRGCIPLIMVLFAVTSCFCGGSCGLTVLPDVDSWQQAIPFILVAAGIGIFMGEALLHFITGLMATTLGATVISAEIEAQTFSLLRLTSMPVREIVLDKFGAVMRQIRTPVLMNMLVRALIVAVSITLLIVGVILLALAGGAANPDIPIPQLPPITALSAVGYAVVALIVLIAALIWLLYYIIEPLLDFSLFAAVGVFASSFAKSRSGGLVTAGVFRFGLAIVAYVVGQIFSSLLSVAAMPLMMLPSLPEWISRTQIAPGILIVIGAVLAVLAILGRGLFELAVTIILLIMTSERATHLPRLE